MFIYTPYALPLIVSAFLSTTLALYGWYHRKHRFARYFVLVMVALTVWAGFYTLEIMSVDLDDRVFWANLGFLGISYIPPIIFMGATEYIGQFERLKWVSQIAFIIPTLTNLIIWTNDYHSLWLKTPSLDILSSPLTTVDYDYGVWFYWVYVPHAWLLVAGIFALLFSVVVSKAGTYRKQALFIIIALLIPFLADVIYIVGFDFVPRMSISPIAYIISSILIALALYRYKLLDLMPIARELILSKMDDIVIVIDPELRIIEANKSIEQITSHTAQSAIGLPITDLLQDTDIVGQIASSQNMFESDILLNHHAFNMKLLPMEQSNRHLGHMIVLRDISAQKAIIEKDKQLALEQQRNQLQYQLITNISHDLLTPITIIKTSLYIARKTSQESIFQAKMGNAEHQVDRLQDMIEDMLFMAKVEMLETLNICPIELQHLFQNLLAAYHHKAQSRQQVLTLNNNCTEATLLPIDHEYMSVALSRLLDNALLYTPDQGNIQVNIDCKDKQWLLTIEDDGIGISEADLANIYRPFYRAKTHRPAEGGTGLGLTIAKRIIELHGGQIRIESKLGEGTQVRVELPLMDN